MPQPTVMCEVNSCTHWLPGNLCGAENIDILHEEPQNMARAAPHTQCKTFYKRGGITSYLGSMDNVNWSGLVSGPVRAGQQITPSVSCIVDSCKYWEEGNLCLAKTITVTGNNADECQDTNCQTFTLK
ncbi:DUF1540 domain-containing protein [Peptococcaceae bacterium 1198_IL3148]